MFKQMGAFFRVFRAGMALADVVKGKQIQIAAGYIAALLTSLVGLAKAFGIDMPLTDAQIMELSGAVVTVFGLFNHAATVATTQKLGLLGQTPQPGPVDVPSQSGLSTLPPDIPAAMRYLRRDHGEILRDDEPGP